MEIKALTLNPIEMQFLVQLKKLALALGECDKETPQL